MDEETRRVVRERAGEKCEYCGLTELQSPFARLQIDHIRPRQHGGTDSTENLALACIDCNLKKGPNLTGVDPMTDGITPLFNPRTQRWEDHFRWEGFRLAGITDTGRATIAILAMNSEERLDVRMAWS